MNREPRHKDTGETISEVIAKIPNELDHDAVGVWHIIPDGETGFGLDGEALAEFLRRAIHALLEAGAVPVRHVAGTGYEWVYQKQYGVDREEIADAIVQEWKPVPNESYAMIENCPWFARPDPAYPKYVKMD